MSATEQALRWTTVAAQAASAKLGKEIRAFDMSEQLAITDIFLLVSADNERQVGAVVDGIQEQMIKEFDARPVRREGDRQNRWVLLDYGEVVVHVQHTEEREFYSLERLWRDCPQLDLDIEERR